MLIFCYEVINDVTSPERQEKVISCTLNPTLVGQHIVKMNIFSHNRGAVITLVFIK